ncbi:PHP domain-containing protein [Janibacter sp. G1551]|uniref:PHP domain-containing protein n=1 Tax=Janibacter sp. G1551 TaxID=3420440 RepID=UPI003D08E92A
MGHSHGPHDHHDHTHGHSHDEVVTPATDLSVPDAELPPPDLGRRNFLRAAGVIGAGVAATSLVDGSGLATASAAEGSQAAGANPQRGFRWLAGDHHIHTQFSSDGLYTVEDQVKHAAAFGLDWVVITDHGGSQHSRIGVEKVNPHIRASRERHEGMFVFQGLEWNIPSAEHGTVFVHPGRNEVDVLKAFEQGYDGSVIGAGHSAAWEQRAIEGLQFLQTAVDSQRVADAVMLANHPARQGIDSPHEVRAWRDAADIAIGWEGAPGHQAAGIAAPLGPGSARGYYGNAPRADRSHPGYPLESYRTWGGFDFYTAAVGGLWDSLLAEGKPWWISANSDSHSNYLDTAQRGPGSDFTTNGQYNDPVYSGKPNTTAGDYFPGFYSRTNVGATRASYAGVMAGLRAGNVWVDHGRLVDEVDVRVHAGGRTVGLGGVLTARRGSEVEITIRITPAQGSNWAQFVPQLAKVDLIRGAVTGPVADKDTLTAPETRVERTWDVRGQEVIEIRQSLGRVDDRGFYVRLRGSDGNRTQAGFYASAQDATGPAIDVVGDADPWRDLWFYTNPVFVLPQA